MKTRYNSSFGARVMEECQILQSKEDIVSCYCNTFPDIMLCYVKDSTTLTSSPAMGIWEPGGKVESVV